MRIDYKIDENDFLTYQLYVASKSEKIKKNRKRTKLIIPVLYIALALWFMVQDSHSLAFIFFIIALFWFFLYPLWERRRYMNHYKRCIKEHYKDRIGKTASIEFDNELIIAKDSQIESKIVTRELEEIAEISTTIFIKLKGGQSLILPKEKINDIDSLTARLKELATYLHIEYNIDDKWAWK